MIIPVLIMTACTAPVSGSHFQSCKRLCDQASKQATSTRLNAAHTSELFCGHFVSVPFSGQRNILLSEWHHASEYIARLDAYSFGFSNYRVCCLKFACHSLSTAYIICHCHTWTGSRLNSLSYCH